MGEDGDNEVASDQVWNSTKRGTIGEEKKRGGK